MKRELLLFLSAVMAASCSAKGSNQQAYVGTKNNASVKLPPDPFGWAIVDRANKQVGIVTTRLEKRGVAVTVNTRGLPAGVHGLHIHEIAKCTAPTFQSAGAHWNWTLKQHGRKNPRGYHAGDLGNLTVNSDGKGVATFVVAAKDWDPKFVGGLSVVIHAAADDERTDPSGNSGERI